LPPAPDPDIFGRTFDGGEDERSGVRAQAKENGRAEGEGVGKKERPFLLMKTMKLCASPLA
jgi:hypothetical protein